MNQKTPILLIHGSWTTAASWGEFIPALEALGFEVFSPSLRYHDQTLQQQQQLVANISLQDYVDDLEQVLLGFERPAVVLGYSLGGLLAQLLVSRHPQRCRGMILLGTAPMAGVYALYPGVVACLYPYFLRWGFWKKAMQPNQATLQKYMMNHQTAAQQAEFFAGLVAESGRAYAEMALWFLDSKRAAQVDCSRFVNPVLVITGSDDKVLRPAISRATARRYTQAQLVILQAADHMYTMGDNLSKTLAHIQQWSIETQLINPADNKTITKN